MMNKRWKGDVKTREPRYVVGSPQHTKYELQKKKARDKYQENGDALRAAARARVNRKRERNQQWMVNYLQGKACNDCGISDPKVLAFDHLEGHDKFANIADLVSRGYALHRLVAEVKKCRVLCHNCHMLHTIKQVGGSYHTKLKPCTEDEFNMKYGDILHV